MQLIPILPDGTLDQTKLGSELTEMPTVAESVIEATVDLYRRRGYVPPFIGYLAIADSKIVGSCGFAAPASADEAEIAYFTFPGNENRGVATQMASELMRLAAATMAPTQRFIAHTLPETNASTRILTNLGFAHCGEINHPEDGKVWKWKRPDLSFPSQ